jgi:putative SbcD/Mre11-related phosphoesterase
MLTLLLPHPAALIKTAKARTLVIADPHIGWENALQERGIHVPSQTPKLLMKLVALLLEHKPDALVIIGDVKYTVIKAELGEWHDIPDFFTELQGYVNDISIIRGNHDANLEPLLPEKVKLLPATGTVIGDIGLFHGHKWPSPMLLKCKTLLMGHVHPVVVFRDPSGFRLTRQVWAKAQVNKVQLSTTLLQQQRMKVEGTPEATVKKHYGFKPQAANVFMVPSFNDFLGGRALNQTRSGKDGQATMIGPMLRSGIVDMDNAEVYLLDGTYLGTLNQLRNMQ